MQHHELLERIVDSANQNFPALDLGCGEGGDTLFLARKGYNVIAMDISQESPRVVRYCAEAEGLTSLVNIHEQDVRTCAFLDNSFSLINAYNILQKITKEEARNLIRHIRRALIPGGCIVICGFLTTDPLYMHGGRKAFFDPGELRGWFEDYDILFYDEVDVDDPGHVGYPEPHRHSLVQLIARKTA